jgi:hypothetical protein
MARPQRSKPGIAEPQVIGQTPTAEKFTLEWLLSRVAFTDGREAAQQLEKVLVRCFNREMSPEAETDLPTLLRLVECRVGLDARTKVAEVVGPILALTEPTDPSRVEGDPIGRTRDPRERRSAAARGGESPMRADAANDDFRKLVTAERAFRDQLPNLLHSHAGQWIAYHGTEVIGIGAKKADVYRTTRERGLRTEDVLVRCIEPLVEELVFGLD